MVWAWFVELFEAGACVVLVPVPELDDWPAPVCPVEDGDCVWAEFVEGFVCADPDEVLLAGAEVEDDGSRTPADVASKSGWSSTSSAKIERRPKSRSRRRRS